MNIKIVESARHGKACAGAKTTNTIQVQDHCLQGAYLLKGQFRYKVGDLEGKAAAMQKAEKLKANLQAGRTVKCPQCNGKGKLRIQATEITAKGSKRLPVVEITCITCDGHEMITEAQAKRHQELLDAWCKCEEPGEACYYNLGSCHGYTCSKCGKILQTG